MLSTVQNSKPIETLQSAPHEASMWSHPDIGRMYADFAAHKCYKDINQRLVEMIDPFKRDSVEILDFGSGIGSGTALLLPKLSPLNFRRARNGEVIIGNPIDTVFALDPSAEMQSYARRHLGDSRICFLANSLSSASQQGSLDRNSLDLIISFNTVHLLPEKQEIFQTMYDLMRPSSQLVFSSGFTAQAIAKDHRKACIDLSRTLKENFNPPCFEPKSIPSCSCDEYCRMLEQAGFADIKYSLKEVVLPSRAVKDFIVLPGSFAELIDPETSVSRRYGTAIRLLKESKIPDQHRQWALFSAKKPS